MADRVVKVTLSAAVDEYKRRMAEAAQATKTVGTESEKLTAAKRSFDALGKAGMVTGTLLAAGMGVAVARFAQFDAAMSNVEAATHESAENMELLRDAAIDAGARTVFSANEAANAIEELAKAGVSTADILGGALDASLDLAAAGGLGVAEAAGIAATALKTFNLQGEDMSHVADLLAAGAGKAMGDVTDLSAALAQGGQVAKQTGLSIEETTAGLAAFAAQGLLGSDAGTSFKSMLQRLTPQSAEAQKEMDRLGISAYDASGNFVGLAEFAGNLQGALADLTPEQRNAAMATIFGSDAVRAATVLYSEGESGIRDWITAVDDQGYASETAAKRLDNLKGDLEALGGAMDSALIQTGSGANDALRVLVQSLTGLVDMYNDLPEPAQQATLAIGGGAAAIALAGGAAFTAVPKFLEMKATLDASNISMGRVAMSAGFAGLALGGLFAVVGELARRHAEAQAKARAYADTLEEGTNRVTKASRELAQENLAMEQSWLFISRGSAYDAAEKLGLSLETVTDAATGNVAALRELEEVIKAGAGEQEAAQRVADRLGISLADVSSASTLVAEAVLGENKSIEEAIRVNEQKARANEGMAESAGAAGEAAQTAAGAYLEEADAVSGLADELSRLIETINEANGVGQDAVTANLAYKDALAQVEDAVASNTSAWGDGTQAGRDNMSMLVDLAEKAQRAADAQFDLDGNTDTYRQTLEAGRQTLIDRAQQLGANADQAGALADQIFRIPSETQWEVIAQTAAAQSELNRFLRDASAQVIRIGVTTYRKGSDGEVSFQNQGSSIIGRATGGPVYGPGGPTDDKVPALLSNGEHVMTAAEVQAAGGHARVAQFRAALVSGGMRTAEGKTLIIELPPRGNNESKDNHA